MHKLSSSLLAAGLFASVVTAQAGPGMTDADPVATGFQAMVASTYFTSQAGTTTNPTMFDDNTGLWAASGPNITQVSTGKTGIAGLAAGEYHMCITTSSLGAAYNPQGSGDVVMGKVTWNSGAPKFTANTMANAFNTGGNEFGLMIDGKDGKFAACDYSSGPVLSERANNGVAFPAPVPISGAGGAYVDPAPAHMNGTLGLFWITSGTTISWAPLNLTRSGGTLTAAAIDAAKTVVMISAIDQPHSPTPLFNNSGDAQGMWFSRVLSSDSDQYYTGTLPNTTGGILVHDTPAWSNNGGIAGSRFLAAYSGHYNTLLEGRGSHMTSGNEITVNAAATLTLDLYSPVGTPPLFTSVLGVSLGVAPPIPLGGILGAFGLDATLLGLIVGGPTGSDVDEKASVTFPATDSSLKGVSLAFQAVTAPIAGAAAAFTNTAVCKFN